jgi:hypothetical protein
MHSFADWRRLLGLHPVGPFAPIWLTRNGLVKRLLQADLVPLQELWEGINARLAQTGSQAVPATLAAFATNILCLDETRLDAVGRYLKPLRGLSAHDSACFAGKLVALLDLRAQRWLRLEWREAVHENCRVDMLDFLRGLSVGSLLLFDLGYFSFSFLDTLTQWKLWWVCRYREKTSYRIEHVFYRQREVLDALIWLGTGQKQARHLVRLVRLGDGVGIRMYLTNVCDPQLLSLGEVAQLYARRWDIEIVQPQMTKTKMLTGRGGGDHVTYGEKRKKIEHNHVEIRVWKVSIVAERDATPSSKKTLHFFLRGAIFFRSLHHALTCAQFLHPFSRFLASTFFLTEITAITWTTAWIALLRHCLSTDSADKSHFMSTDHALIGHIRMGACLCEFIPVDIHQFALSFRIHHARLLLPCVTAPSKKALPSSWLCS